MKAKDVIDFVRENPVCTLAALDGGQPPARGFLPVLFDYGKFCFTTAATNGLSGQSFDMQ
jgi:uncharacterized pyridoxamine 5'-phosphate oxidase family protein